MNQANRGRPAGDDRTRQILQEWRDKGRGKLTGKHTLDDLAGEDLFLDGHTWACPPKPGRRYEITVLGDLHGCDSCLKAAIMQSRFLEKVQLFREDPAAHPEPKLVLLGDYIDRGIFSLNGVLRTALLLSCTAPNTWCSYAATTSTSSSSRARYSEG